MANTDSWKSGGVRRGCLRGWHHESNRKKYRQFRISDIAARVDAIDWAQATADLDAQGCAVLKGLLSPEECAALAALYPDDKNFRSRIVMGRHGFGRGEYKYFAYPLPDLIAELRPALYARLAASPIAGTRRWGSTSAIPIATRRS